MTIFRHELRQGRTALIIWTVSIAFLFAVCVFLFPEMKGEMDQISDVFSTMGNFSAAFGMDQVSFGTLTGFYAIECGNILGLGGALYAAMCGISMLSKEEKGHTAEFLLTHPVSRRRIMSGKLAALFFQIMVLNAFVLLISIISIYAVGEDIPWKEILLLHLAYCISYSLQQSRMLHRAFPALPLLRPGLYLLQFLYLLRNRTEKYTSEIQRIQIYLQ